jgi:hypothetical protein
MDSQDTQLQGKRRVEAIVDRVTSTSRQWARQSLSAGKRALENSAKTLVKTASSLEELARKLEPEGDGGSTESKGDHAVNGQGSSAP